MPRADPRNVSRYWWDRHTPGLSLLSADFETHEYPPHVHEAFVVAVTEDGGSIIKSRGVVEEAHASRLFVFNPGEPHAGWMGRSRRWRYRSLYLTRQAIDELARGLGVEDVPYFTANMFPDADLIAAFLALHRALEQGRDAFHADELLIGSFGRLFRRRGDGGRRIEAGPRDDRRAAKAIACMQERLAEPLRLDDVAQAAGLTKFQLIELFKKTVHMTPHAYLTQLRLNEACRHLRRGAPIAEAAAACGFCDQAALAKHFKRCYGITPRQFAEASRNFRQYRRRAAA